MAQMDHCCHRGKYQNILASDHEGYLPVQVTLKLNSLLLLQADGICNETCKRHPRTLNISL